MGRVNRLLHWRDMPRYRNEGLLTYDLGGWYAGRVDLEKLRINQFNAGFGGVVVREGNFEIGETLPASLIVGARRAVYGFRNPMGLAFRSRALPLPSPGVVSPQLSPKAQAIL